MIQAISNAVKGLTNINPLASIIGAGIGASASLIGGSKQNVANAQMAQNQMDFQERMRQTQYQTAVADLKAAGLNPMLAYSQGGAGTPQGATAQMGNPLGEAGSSAREAAIAVANFKQLQTQNVLTQEQAEDTASAAELKKDTAALTRTQTAVELAKMPGYGKYGQFVDAQMNQLNSSAAQAMSSSAYQAEQERYTQQLTRLAKAGAAPSSQKPIYQDAKSAALYGLDRFNKYPTLTTPNLKGFGLK